MAKLSAEEEKEIKALFDSIDINKDGRITLKELAKHMVETEGTREDADEVKALFKVIDVDASGEITFQEYLTFFTKTDEQIDSDLNEATTAVLFEALDTDGNGFIDKAEMRKGLRVWGEEVEEEQFMAMFHEFDTNDDGVISLEEFRGLLKRLKS